jgi:hypothetical protein
MVAETDREAFAMALRACGHVPDGRERIVRILDTLHLEDVYVSAPLLRELCSRESIETLNTGSELFTDSGDLTPF